MLEAELVGEIELESARLSAQSSARFDVVEVVTRGERRRHRSEDERANILTEAMAPGAVVAQVARRWGVSTSQLYNWRKAMLVQAAPSGGQPAMSAPSFAQVQLAAAEPTPGPPTVATPAGLIEIVLPGGALVRVDAAVDGAALRRVLAALSAR